jgi:hypothetical protein
VPFIGAVSNTWGFTPSPRPCSARTGGRTGLGARVADRRAAREGHGAGVAGGDAWRDASPEAWGRARGVGRRRNIIGMHGPAEGAQTLRSRWRHAAACLGHIALERRMLATPPLAFDLALFDHRVLEKFKPNFKNSECESCRASIGEYFS